MKTIKHYFPVLLFISHCKAILVLESGSQPLPITDMKDPEHNSHHTVYYAVQGDFNF